MFFTKYRLINSVKIKSEIPVDDSWMISWPFQLAVELNEQSNYTVNPHVIAQTGWASFQLLNYLRENEINETFDFVTILIGVNDQFWGRDIGDYASDFRILLQKAINYTGGNEDRVIVLSIPDYSVTPFVDPSIKERVRVQINQFNYINYHETLEAGAHYVNITGISRLAGEDLTLLAYDGLHPSALMYSKWVDVLLPIVHSAINSTKKSNLDDIMEILEENMVDPDKNVNKSFFSLFFGIIIVSFLIITIIFRFFLLRKLIKKDNIFSAKHS